MKFPRKTLLYALACLSFFFSFALDATAHSMVRIYGTIDAGIEYVNTGDPSGNRLLKASSGSGRASRLMFEGKEELNPDLSVTFALDIGFWGDNGKNNPTGPGSTGIFGHRSVLGLNHKQMGGITVGREFTPQFRLGARSDIAGLSYYGNTVTRNQVTARASNAIEYTSPTMHGISMMVLWNAGETVLNNTGESSVPPFDEGRQKAVSVEYNSETLFVGYAYATTALKQLFPENATALTKEHFIGFKYRAQHFTLNGSWTLIDPYGQNNDRKTTILGVSHRLTPISQIGMQWSRSRRDAEKGIEPTENAISMHGSYDLSKRTMLYINLARQANNSTSSQAFIGSLGANTITPATKGTNIKVVLIGMVHSF